MPALDRNSRMGNAGADRVSALLSPSCSVRAVARDDIGIDLYCETLSNHQPQQPFVHFWVQVKAGQQCRLSSDGSTASFGFSTDHLRYWARQPVPVFAALVPCARPEDAERAPVYVVDVTDFVLEHGVPANQKSKTIGSKYLWRGADDPAVAHFLKQRVPECTALIQCLQGFVAPMPNLMNPFISSWPTAPVHRYQHEIQGQIRRTAAMSIMFLRELGKIDEETAEFRRRLAQVLEQFSDDRHWETWSALAMSAHADGQFGEAAELYQRAVDMIRADDGFRNSLIGPLYMQGLLQDKECATRGESLPPLWQTSF